MAHPITTCIWFDGQAKQAAEFYCSVFRDSRITADTPMVVTWELNGTRFMGLNGGPQFQPDEAISFVVHCDDQEEIDYYWEKLLAEGGQGIGARQDQHGVGGRLMQRGCGVNDVSLLLYRVAA